MVHSAREAILLPSVQAPAADQRDGEGVGGLEGAEESVKKGAAENGHSESQVGDKKDKEDSDETRAGAEGKTDGTSTAADDAAGLAGGVGEADGGGDASGAGAAAAESQTQASSASAAVNLQAEPPSAGHVLGAEGGQHEGKGLLKSHITVCGMMWFQMFAIPDAPKQIGQWLVRSEHPDGNEKGLQDLRYPEVTITGAVKQEPPLTLSMVAPRDMIIVPGGHLTCGRWDEKLACWVQDGVENFEISDRHDTAETRDLEIEDAQGEEGVEAVEEVAGTSEQPAEPEKGSASEPAVSSVRTIKFQTAYLSHLALLQSRLAALPYSAWRVCPFQDPSKHSLVTLHLACDWLLHILVSSKGCRIIPPAPAAIGSLEDEELDAEELLRRLKARGLNLMPCDADFKLLVQEYFEWHPPLKAPMGAPKHAVVEALACRDLTMMAPSMVIEGSQYNHWVGSSDAVIAVKPAGAQEAGAHPMTEPQARGQDSGWTQVL